MAENKADQSGMPPKEVRQAVKGASIFELARLKFDTWKRSRVYRRRAKKAARTRAANLLGITPKSRKPLKVNWGRVIRGALLVLVLLWLALMAIYLVGRLRAVPSGTEAETPIATPTMMDTAVPAAASTSVDEPVGPSDEVVYLRVETLELDTAYNIWRRAPGVTVFLSPYKEGDSAADPEREGTLRQVTEELVTSDDVLVAVTTFESQPGLYWTWVDEDSLTPGCAVWVPRFDADADSEIQVDEPVVVRLDSYQGFNTTLVKFQIVCGLEVEVVPTVVNTQPPQSTPTDPPPTDPPGPTPTPEPTDPPEDPSPTPEPTEVECNCDPPSTPVPTPEPIEVTATPSR